MATTVEIKFPFRVVVHRERNKVVFAEAENDLIDILLSFLTLPLETIVRVFKEHTDSTPNAIGSLTSLYESLSNLDTKYFWSEECKKMLLKPRNSAEAQCRKLKLNIDGNEPTKYFICEDWACSRANRALSNCNTARCHCGKLVNREIDLKSYNAITGQDNGGVFATETATFIVTDDLRVMPNFPASVLGLLCELGIGDMMVLEEKSLNIGLKEILSLLKLSLLSQTLLTDLFLHKSDIVKPELRISAQPQIGNKTTNNSEKMTVKVMVQKSNNKALFVQAGEDFIDFLFSFFTIPLGRVISILGADSSLKCLYSFYKSIRSMDIGPFIKSEDLREELIKPCVAPLHLCKNQILGRHEVRNPLYYCHVFSNHNNTGKVGGHLSLFKGSIFGLGELYHSQLSFRDPKVNGGFVRGPAFFMVTDDLVVTPMSTISSLSYLSRLKIPFSDVEEHVITIGIDEALSILEASLRSNSALSSGLKNLILKKPKQEN